VQQPYLEKPGYFEYTVFLKEVPPDVTTKLEQLCAGFAVGSEAPERGRPHQEDGTIRAGINYWECFGITKQQVMKNGIESVPYPKVKDARGVCSFVNDSPDVVAVDGSIVQYGEKVALFCEPVSGKGGFNTVDVTDSIRTQNLRTSRQKSKKVKEINSILSISGLCAGMQVTLRETWTERSVEESPNSNLLGRADATSWRSGMGSVLHTPI
jgi:hypothetical protein